MRRKLFILAIYLLFLETTAFAEEAPTLLSPSNNSTVTSSKLEWQIPSYSLYSGGSFYMVQVDNQSSFESPEKNNIYLTKNSYTPQLTSETWYWRIKAKDASGTWSNWSNAWSFILSNSTPTPSTTTMPTSTPIPTSIITPSPITQPVAENSVSSFIISDIPSQIDSNQSFKIKVNLFLPNYPNLTFYLKGAFKKSDGSNYFGFTKFAGSWVKNGNSYSVQYPITTDSSGNWSNNIEVKPDSEDSGFTGSGDYIFKIARYSSSGTGPTWSNDLSINILESKENNNQNTTSGELSISNSITSTSNPSSQSNSISKNTPFPSSKSSSINITYKVASVAGASTSAKPETENKSQEKKKNNSFFAIGLTLVFAGIGSLGYIYWKRR